MIYNKELGVEELCRKLRPILGEKIDKVYLKYRLADNNDTRQEIEQALNALYHNYLDKSLLNEKVLLENPPEEIIDADYKLANIVYNEQELYPFCLREQDFVRHVCITGMSGSGKTNFAFHIIKNFIQKNKPFIILDWKKSFRPLMLEDDKIDCFTIGNNKVANLFRININRPPSGVDPKEWINLLCDLITECFFASFGVHKILLETLDNTFRDFKVYQGSGNYPTWHQIRDRLEERAEELRNKGRESEWITSALRIAHALTFGAFGECINHKGKGSYKIEELLNKKTIMELTSLSNTEKKFFCDFLLTYIYKHEKMNQEGVNEFKTAIIVDEAHNIFLKDRPHFIQETVTDMIYREMREYGISLICLDQHISKLSDTVTGNSACNITFNQMLPYDIDIASRLMQLIDKKNYFSMLPVGTAIVKLAERYTRPFLIRVKLYEFNGSVSDEDIKRKMENLKDNKEDIKEKFDKINKIFKISGVDTSEQEKEFEKTYLNDNQVLIKEYLVKNVANYNLELLKNKLINAGHKITDIDYVLNIINEENKRKIYKEDYALDNTSLSFDQQKLINYIKKYPEFGITNVYKQLNFSPRKGNKIKNELMDMGLVSIEVKKSDKGWSKRVRINPVKTLGNSK